MGLFEEKLRRGGGARCCPPFGQMLLVDFAVEVCITKKWKHQPDKCCLAAERASAEPACYCRHLRLKEGGAA